jgi:glyoxylase-like metal-dependent hydrolase (beta-lactamase superfamily II)
MASVEVLVTGYVDEGDQGDLVQPTVSLVRSGDCVIVVDPGILKRTQDLVEALVQRDLTVSDVSHVFVTHHHIDHTRNVGLFPHATVVDRDSSYTRDVWAAHDGDGYALADDVSVIQTPGHTDECASLVARTPEGVVVMTHAWWFPDMTPVEDPLADDQAQLSASRARILEIADMVIPGHGAPFRPRSL